SPARMRRESVVVEHLLDSAGVHADPHAAQLLGNAPLPPRAVLALQRHDELGDARVETTATTGGHRLIAALAELAGPPLNGRQRRRQVVALEGVVAQREQVREDLAGALLERALRLLSGRLLLTFQTQL